MYTPTQTQARTHTQSSIGPNYIMNDGRREGLRYVCVCVCDLSEHVCPEAVCPLTDSRPLLLCHSVSVSNSSHYGLITSVII